MAIMHNAFEEPKSLNVLEIGDGKDHRTMTYSVDKPHPGYGKDPNILNEYGHSVYPKMLYPNGNTQPGVVVNSAAEEARYYKPEDLKQDGPTVEEFVKAGYKASDYPPSGYASKSSEEDIKKAIEAQSKPAAAPWG